VGRALEDCPLIHRGTVNMVRVFDKRLTGFYASPQEYIELMDSLTCL